MKRKIVSTFIGPDNSRWQGRLLEVCEDGSIFGWDFSEGKWVEDFPPLPGASDLIHRKPLKQGDIVRFVCEGKIDGFASDDNVIVNMQGCATIINQRDILPDNRDAPDPQPSPAAENPDIDPEAANLREYIRKCKLDLASLKPWERQYLRGYFAGSDSTEPSPAAAPALKVGDVVDHIVSLMADVDLWDVRSRRVFRSFGSHLRLAPKPKDLKHVRDRIKELMEKIPTPAEKAAFERAKKGGGK